MSDRPDEKGLEREDAPASDTSLEPTTGSDDVAGPAPHQVQIRRGMFGAAGSGDTSGFGRLQRVVEMPQPTAPPYGGWFDTVADEMAQVLPAGAVTAVVVHRGEITFTIERRHLLEVARALRDTPTLRFEHCASVSGVHLPTQQGAEMHVVYHLQSMTHNRRIRLEVTCPDADPHVPSVVSVYPAADWHERETWDMFGVQFDGHPALTRILMPDDWPGHPQRKDYPLGGIDIEYKGAVVAPPETRRSYT
ncbi:NADH-quinone oxidoreductase subunit C [Desertihabitans brevis]|uniref:NADH-quinone oxidoreductase subunit C n=1 Tax=Desertihabitans brevis TaxID=2268447 RepID=A0A367YV46_9ACTN|nr:NADH-quinone oxidoreductase subunit C [Desertihabitans brevis]RCK69680.1 NADH-quinone oxidoreductase subunit C [Desertihabitans brevis]